MRRLLIIGAAVIVWAYMVVNTARGADACKGGAKAAQRSCTAGAKSDYALALGKCANIANSAAQKACRAQAKADLADAMSECQDQLDARLEACDRLGGGVYDPPINPSHFSTTIDNPLLPMVPGTTFVYVSPIESNVVTVTHNTRVIDGVTCVEVHDVVYTDGAVTEDTLDWFAQDSASNVWYFGESTVEFVDGLPASLEGSWMAGVDGAKPGIVMQGNPMLGQFYRQEFLLGTAEDLAEVTGLNETVDVPAGHFDGCLKFRETTPLEPDAMEDKFYAPGVGQILDIDLESGEHLELVQVIGP